MKIIPPILRRIFVLILLLLPNFGFAAEIDRFVGAYVGTSEAILDGEAQKRDMNVVIAETKLGFALTWTSVTYKTDGRTKKKTYTVEFVPSNRDHIYQSAMKMSLFGKAIPLDPLDGDPFVWARFEGDTFSVFSLIIDENGEYEVQEYHRTLVDGDLELVFLSIRSGVPQREIKTILLRED
jgi:hypothetical protein